MQMKHKATSRELKLSSWQQRKMVVLFNSQKVQNLQGGAAVDTQSSSVIMDLNYRNTKQEGIFVKDSSKESL